MCIRTLGISLLSLALLTTAFGQTPPITVTFSSQTYNTGPSPVAVVSGDFNQDGQPDLAVIDDQSSSVQILLGQGGGLFSLGSQTTTGAGPTQIVTGTFNLTGHQDLAVANSDKTMTILIGKGDGTFVTESFPLTGVPMAMIAGDFLNDGLTQLATVECAAAGQAPCSLNIYQSDAHALFAHSLSIPLPSAPVFTGLIASDDLNHVHKPGLAVAVQNQVLIFVNTSTFDGAGAVKLAHSVTITPPNTVTIVGLAAGHFVTGNPTPDLAIEVFDSNSTENTNSDYIFLNNGFGSFFLRSKVPGTGAFGHVLTVSDINGDGIQDLIIAGTSVHNGDLSHALGHGDGTFSAVQAVQEGSASGINRGIIARDLNLDSRHDLVIPSAGPLGGPAFTAVFLNQNALTNCPPPGSAKLAVKFCSVSTAANQISVTASGNSPNGVKRVELWIDGVKRTQNFSDQLKAAVSASPGLHRVTVVGVDLYDALIKQTTFVGVP